MFFEERKEMSTYTREDQNNAALYSEQRKRLMYMHKLYEKYPHLVSHLDYSIRKADRQKDYYYPVSLENSAIIVQVNITKELCDTYSCNSSGRMGACKPDSVAQYYRVGETNNFELQCNPACFNLKKTLTFNETGSESVQNTRYRWSKRKNVCEMVPVIASWLEHPLYRSKELYEHRVNDLETGFDYDPRKDRYTINKYYCNVFFDEFNPETKNCESTWTDFIIGSVVGSTLLKYVKAGIVALENTDGGTMPKLDLPDPPEIENKWTVDGWLSNVNHTFKLPPIDVGLDGVAVKPEFTTTTIPSTVKHRVRRDLVDTSTSSGSVSGVGSSTSSSTEIPRGAEILRDVLQSVFSKETASQVAIDYTLQKVYAETKEILVTVSDRMVPRILKMLAEQGARVSDQVFKASLSGLIKQTVVSVGVKSAGKIASFLASSLSLMSTGIGIVLVVVQLLDIILTFWDPMGLNAKYPPGYLDTLYDKAKFALREQLNTNETHLTFDWMCSFLLTTEEHFQIAAESYPYMYEYLDALTVNSTGQRIDKGVNLDAKELNSDKALLEAKLYTPLEFNDYEKDHIDRRHMFKTLESLSTAFLTIGACCALFRLHLLSIVSFLVAVFVAALSFANIQFKVWHLYEKLKIPIPV